MGNSMDSWNGKVEMTSLEVLILIDWVLKIEKHWLRQRRESSWLEWTRNWKHLKQTQLKIRCQLFTKQIQNWWKSVIMSKPKSKKPTSLKLMKNSSLQSISKVLICTLWTISSPKPNFKNSTQFDSLPTKKERKSKEKFTIWNLKCKGKSMSMT